MLRRIRDPRSDGPRLDAWGRGQHRHHGRRGLTPRKAPPLSRAGRVVYRVARRRGWVAEWFKAPVLKTGVGSRPPWVRIPPHPPCMGDNILICIGLIALTTG